MSAIILENRDLRIQVSSFGAEMQSFFDKTRNIECLWQANDHYWARHAPILFPIVGRLTNDQLKYQNHSYPMTQHGFARDSEFEVLNYDETSVRLSLHSNEQSRKQYPFDFELIVEYNLDSNTLSTAYTIRNPNNSILPASIGAHPAFNWPLCPEVAKPEHLIIFENDENTEIRRLKNGLLLDEKFKSPIKKNQLNLDDSLFEYDALIFDHLESRKLKYASGNELSITLSFNDFPHLGIWTKPGAPFICLEPWQGHSSPMNFDGEFNEKPGILLIPAHSEIKKSFDIILN